MQQALHKCPLLPTLEADCHSSEVVVVLVECLLQIAGHSLSFSSLQLDGDCDSLLFQVGQSLAYLPDQKGHQDFEFRCDH